MSHSHDRQESRNNRWQQRQREESQEQRNRQGAQQRTQGEHSGQQRHEPEYDRERAYRGTENRWNPDWESQSQQSRRNPGGYGSTSGRNYGEREMVDSYYNPRENRESWNEPRNFNGEESNREWVSGTEEPPYREMHPGRYPGSSYMGMENTSSGNPAAISRFPSRGQAMGRNAWANPAMENSQDYSASRPSYAGRGPQGYKRSDDRITEDINEEMTRAHDLDPTNITVETRNGEVVLKGTVSDRESKRRAEEIAEACSGVQDVQNQIRVKREASADAESSSHHEQSRGDDKRSKMVS